MLCYKGIEDTNLWFNKAKPEPTEKDLSTQIGVHLEEVAEMLRELGHDNPDISVLISKVAANVSSLGDVLKMNEGVIIPNRVEFLDSLCDQIVTAVGSANLAKMDIIAGLNEVNRSNFSKFDDNGNPLLDINRKIIKGPNYSKPDLSQMV